MKKVALTITIGQFLLGTISELQVELLNSNTLRELILIQYLTLILISSFCIMIILYILIPKQMYLLCLPENINSNLTLKEIDEFSSKRIICHTRSVAFLYILYFLQNLTL